MNVCMYIVGGLHSNVILDIDTTESKITMGKIKTNLLILRTHFWSEQ